MDTNLRKNFENSIKLTNEEDFENFVKALHFEKFGTDDFISTRDTKDKGCDGVVVSTKTIIASYGPIKYTKPKFDKKAGDDFGKYLTHWVKQYPNWVMYFNGDIAPDQILKINELKLLAGRRGFKKIKVGIKGADHILDTIEKDLKNIQIRRLALHLNIPQELFIKDYIREILDDLISGLTIELKNVEYALKVDIEEKILLNYSKAELADAKREYEELAINGTLRDIQNAFSNYEDEDINKIKLKIIRDFAEFGGSFKQKLDALANKYYQKYSSGNDDDFDYYIRAILIYCFEQCIIGVKTIKETTK